MGGLQKIGLLSLLLFVLIGTSGCEQCSTCQVFVTGTEVLLEEHEFCGKKKRVEDWELELKDEYSFDNIFTVECIRAK